MLGYDKQQVSSLGVDMVMYLGELAANTILDTEDNNINTELEEYTTKGDRNNVFSMIKVLSNLYWCSINLEILCCEDGYGQIKYEG